MSEMVKRVVRAICIAGGNSDGGCCYTDDCPDGCRLIDKENRTCIARIAITAMRDPTDKMKAAGPLWQAMIDKALE